MFEFDVQAGSKAELYRDLVSALDALTADEPDPVANMANAAALMWQYLPDLNWAGGLTEVMKISALATTFDLITICHQGVSPPGMAWSSAQSPIHTPYVEMLVKHASMSYFFDANGGPNFENGELTVSKHPGLGFEIDDSKIESEQAIEY